MIDQERAAMQQALKCLETPIHEQPLGMRTQTASALRAALAQEQAEPSGYCTLEQLVVMQRTVPSPDKIAIYTAPPQRPPLTDEEIVDAVRDADLDWQAGWTLDEHEPNRFTTLARAIERAVRGEA